MNREELLKKCGLNNTLETSHCFNDTTHITCCELGEQARRYADSSGNPIGKLSEKVAGKKEGLVPWCTCAGSQVCSFYKNKFNDGTKIKFIYNPKTGEIIDNVDNERREFEKTGFREHSTPGIENFSFPKNRDDIIDTIQKHKVLFFILFLILLVCFIISIVNKLLIVSIILGIGVFLLFGINLLSVIYSFAKSKV
jgi:hypothetical protein